MSLNGGSGSLLPSCRTASFWSGACEASKRKWSMTFAGLTAIGTGLYTGEWSRAIICAVLLIVLYFYVGRSQMAFCPFFGVLQDRTGIRCVWRDSGVTSRQLLTAAQSAWRWGRCAEMMWEIAMKRVAFVPASEMPLWVSAKHIGQFRSVGSSYRRSLRQRPCGQGRAFQFRADLFALR